MNLIKTIMEFNNDEKLEAFYNLCSADLNTVQIKKLLLNPEVKEYINSPLLVAGLLGAIGNNRDKYINTIFDFVNEQKISFNKEEINILFNYASANNKIQLINFLDEKFSVIETALSSSSEEYLNKNNVESREKSIYMNFLQFMDDIQALSINPFTFSLIKNNFELVDKMLEKDYKISPSLVKSVFIRFLETGNKDSAIYLAKNGKTTKFLFNSGRINEVLTNNKSHLELKNEISIILNAKELEKTLKINDEKKPPKLKL